MWLLNLTLPDRLIPRTRRRRLRSWPGMEISTTLWHRMAIGLTSRAMVLAGSRPWWWATRRGNRTTIAAAGFIRIAAGTGSRIIPGAGPRFIMGAGFIINASAGAGCLTASGDRRGFPGDTP